MARPLRIEYEGAFYHVTGRGNERRKIFRSESDYKQFKEYIRGAQEKYGLILHCYVLMGNHYHLIAETPAGNLSQIMHYINGSYTTYFNIKRKRSGHLFQGRYKALLVDKDRYLLQLSRYLHLNPVRAGMVKRPEEYPYSSYQSYIGQAEGDIVHRDLLWSMIFQDRRQAPQRYKKFLEDAMGVETESPLKEVLGGVILGGEGFRGEVLSRVADENLQSKEVSHRRALKKTPGAEAIIQVMCSHFKVSRDDLLCGKGEARNIAIFLTKKNTALTNRQIGELFGKISYSAVSRVYERLSRRAVKNKELEKEISNIQKTMSNVKG